MEFELVPQCPEVRRAVVLGAGRRDTFGAGSPAMVGQKSPIGFHVVPVCGRRPSAYLTVVDPNFYPNRVRRDNGADVCVALSLVVRTCEITTQ